MDEAFGSCDWIKISDLILTMEVLYQLSYTGDQVFHKASHNHSSFLRTRVLCCGHNVYSCDRG